MSEQGKVYFIGAGPGDPDLITVKGRRIVERADVIIYAGSLVNREIIECHKKDALVYNSASMTLDEVIDVIKKHIGPGKVIARVHTGDPSIYGAIREQIDILQSLSIPYEVIPGVSSFTAAAAVLGMEFTLPGVSQTVICTRLEGRTPVPEKEDLELLASHRASMAIFLSVHMIDDVVKKLKVHYDENTPVAIVQKATWSDQRIERGTLETIGSLISDKGIDKTAMILVGDFLGNDYDRSLLYNDTFTHGYRKGK
jgi:precorrin-4/cobalt-precorrin-4 C11-methyltransferase